MMAEDAMSSSKVCKARAIRRYVEERSILATLMVEPFGRWMLAALMNMLSLASRAVRSSWIS